MKVSSFIFIGDSLTQFGFEKNGWLSRLSDRFSTKALCLPFGFSGYSSKYILPEVPSILEMCKSLNPTLAIVFLGANDARLSKEDIFFQHVPVEDYKTNLTKIVNLLKAEKLSVILCTPPTLDDEEWNKECIRKGLPSYNRLKKNTKLYAIACKEVAGAENIPCLDTFSLFENNEENIEKLFNDGLHFSEMGNEIFFKALVEMLNNQGFNPENLNAFLPYYRDIRFVQKQSEE